MTKSLFTLLLSLATVSGCAKFPTLGAPAPERETVAKVNWVKQPKQPVAEGKLGPNYVDHRTTNGLSTTDAGASGAAMAGSPTTAGAGGEVAAGTLDVQTKPDHALRAFPIFEGEDQVTDVEFSPAGAPAIWQLAVGGNPTVGAVKFTISDGEGGDGTPFTVAPKDVGLTPRLFGTATLTWSPAQSEVIAFLKAHPKAHQVVLTAGIDDAAGRPIQTKAGKPLALTLSLQVL